MATIAAPPVTKTTLDVLRDARALYSENPSHAPENECPVPGTHCVITALDRAWPGDDDDEMFWRTVSVFQRYGIGESILSLPQWNAEHTTEEVLAAFDKAIAAVEAS